MTLDTIRCRSGRVGKLAFGDWRDVLGTWYLAFCGKWGVYVDGHFNRTAPVFERDRSV